MADKGSIHEVGVNCIFGHDHTVKVELGPDRRVLSVVSSCDAEKEETRGLIQLGTDPLSTCLGIKELFIDHVKSGDTIREYSMDARYTKTMLFPVGQYGAEFVRRVRAEREAQKEVDRAKARMAAQNDLVTRRLNEMLKDYGQHQLSAFGVSKNSQGKYEFGSKTATNRWSREPAKFFPVGVRNNGKWYVDRGFREQEQWYHIISSWGGDCPVCGNGYSHHCDTKGHKSKMEKWLMIGMQITSSEGQKLLKADPEHTFTYRKNAKNIVGVEFV